MLIWKPASKTEKSTESVRTLAHKVGQLSVEEFQNVTDEFTKRNALRRTSREDILTAIQAQCAYSRRIISASTQSSRPTFRAHAVYRAIRAEPVATSGFLNSQDRL
ncbi:uncharacterized protein PHALS_04979 [Plasmopara halstedii]|uniref:Uncharacterized protein n=1 Tax=Plasmopara halstedii TaxID=4781 RepID=A0A0P1AA60_PLAHL|nr:uncharacterized protein PHALS_04979 [Plasmopara halstedii]CEG37385.1 hypothetical protein PHALS_04979 [Plasmopara halstedii]|eukprot:XP_024573754.1 hypothetical protein PHALS_04979 [Plasmopara halstedii]